ncbi:hypothetical protein [Frondihabitans australicus]|nr:hypothetical protein [Frondihabitans australicus]
MTERRERDPSRRSLRPPTKDFPSRQPWKWLYRWIAFPILRVLGVLLEGF